MKKKLFLHIGYGKAASTFLQSIFNNNPKINCIYLRNKEKNPIKINKEIKKIKSLAKLNQINLISDESFTSPFSQKNLDIYLRLDKTITILKKIFDLKIIVVIRNQKNWLISRYSQNPLRFFNIDNTFYKYQNLENIYESQFKNLSKHKNLKNNINYENLYNFLVKKIKKKNIKFLIFEELNENYKKTLKELEVFFGKKKAFTNLSIKSSYLYKTKKLDNYYFPKIKLRKFFYLNKIYNLKYTILLYFFNKFLLPKTSKNSLKISRYYKNFNLRLSKKINKDLSRFKYY